MAPINDFLEFASPDAFDKTIPKALRDSVDAMNQKEIMDRFRDLWTHFLGDRNCRPTMEERQEYFLIKKRCLK